MKKLTVFILTLAMACMTGTAVYAEGYSVTDDLRIAAVIQTMEKGPVEAVWHQGGQDTTTAGDRVIWGYFYASPSDVTWGSAQNPDLFVKIWFDRGGRVDVNFFHVSVPTIDVYSDYPNDGTWDKYGITTMSARYVRQYYEYGQAHIDESYEDGDPPPGYHPEGNPDGYAATDDLGIGAVISTLEKGPVDALWYKGGEETTAGGHKVVWGFFYANPSDVDWGNRNNPDLFVKIWFDAGGRIDVNFFHVSVPDIEVYSDFPDDGIYGQKGTTIMDNRYIRHEYWTDPRDNDGDGYTTDQGDCNDYDATVHPGAEEICKDGTDQDCDGTDLDCPPPNEDGDGDGYTADQGDCNDYDATVHPGAEEICEDGIDQDCDGADESCYLEPDDTDDDGDGYTENEGDCNDGDPNVYPGANEICGDGTDQNCDGSDDICFWDADYDGDGDGYSEDQGDCDDNDPAIYPGAEEICDDGTDQDCDGTDPVCPDDSDGDNDGFTENQGDCDDNDPAIHPGAEEICDDGTDQDCDGTDPVCPDDSDDDNDYFTENQGDCDDNDPRIHPGAREICGDGIDQNCNGADVMCSSDTDPDRDGYTKNQGDCREYDSSIHPYAKEICGDGIDQNCDGIDEVCYEDKDDDGYSEDEGDCNDDDPAIHPDAEEICDDEIDQDCSGADLPCDNTDNDNDGYIKGQGDCNDNDVTIHPGADDICGDGIDQDCDGYDKTCPINITDIDNDGYAKGDGDCNDHNPSIYPGADDICGDGIDQDCDGKDTVCPQNRDDDEDGYTENQGDCDDTDDSIHPRAEEVCGDKIDQDCNGTDLACVPDPDDTDDDGDGYTENQGDCNDADASIRPGAVEVCGDGIDQDCDGADLACVPGPDDTDDDGDGYTENQGDCNDADASIRPGAVEVCGDGIDQDCDDADLACVPDPDDIDDDGDGYTENQGDCDDNDPSIHPGAEEICGDEIDQNCDYADLVCDSDPDLEGIIDDYARSYEQSMNDGNIELFMERVSRDFLHNGQDYDCYYESKEWLFNYYDYEGTLYHDISQALRESNDGKQFVTFSATVSYAQILLVQEIRKEFIEDVTLVLEDGKWKLFGNQQNDSLPSVLKMATCESANPLTWELVGVKDVFTNSDEKVTVFISLDNVRDGSVFNVRWYKPDGTLVPQEPYTVDLGDGYPACGRSDYQWPQSYFFPDHSDIPGLEDDWMENVGTWRIELSSAEAGILKQVEFKYIP